MQPEFVTSLRRILTDKRGPRNCTYCGDTGPLAFDANASLAKILIGSEETLSKSSRFVPVITLRCRNCGNLHVLDLETLAPHLLAELELESESPPHDD